MRIRFQLIFFMIARLVQSTGKRMIYPFLTVFARSMGVGIPALSLLISARSGLGVLAPFLGTVSDRLPRKTAMLIGISVFALGNLLIGFFPTFSVLFVGLCLSYIAMMFFHSTAGAYLGDVVAYGRRGQAFALQEVGWGFSFVVGTPLVGWLISHYGLRAPFFVLALASVVLLVGLQRVLPRAKPITINPNGTQLRIYNLGGLLASPSARSVLILMICLGTLNEWMMVIFGLWMETSFALQITALGISAALIGAAEIGGEAIGGVGLTDRLGKKRSVRFGLMVNILGLLVMPWVGRSLLGALGALFIYYLGYEFSFISAMPFATEVLPSARATMVGTTVASIAIGRTLAAALSPLVFATLGFEANAYLALLLVAMALIALRGVRLET
jgi:predicted MFS family arabinose efflux permease